MPRNCSEAARLSLDSTPTPMPPDLAHRDPSSETGNALQLKTMPRPRTPAGAVWMRRRWSGMEWVRIAVGPAFINAQQEDTPA